MYSPVASFFGAPSLKNRNKPHVPGFLIADAEDELLLLPALVLLLAAGAGRLTVGAEFVLLAVFVAVLAAGVADVPDVETVPPLDEKLMFTPVSVPPAAGNFNFTDASDLTG